VAFQPKFESWKTQLVHPVCKRVAPGRQLPLVDARLNCSIENYELNPVYQSCPDCALEHVGVPRNLSHSSFENHVSAVPEQYTVAATCQEFANDLVGFLSLIGSVGTGKTHLAVSILRVVLQRLSRRDVRFMTFSELLAIKRDTYRQSSKRAHHDDEAAEDPIHEIQRIKFLVLDELRLAGACDEEPLLFEIVDYRATNYLPTVLTSNTLLGQLESAIGSRSFDRIRGAQFATLGFNWDSHRPASNADYLERAARMR
jgi:DNA replication protein DnaC